MPEGPKIDAKELEEDGFGSNPFYHCFAAENPDKPNELVGFVLYFFTYSTWEGRSIYMEDLYVTPAFRGKGLGKKLWQSCVQVFKYPGPPRQPRIDPCLDFWFHK